jgi:hypothetical protein
VGEEAAGVKVDAVCETVAGDVVLEDGADLGQVEADSGDVRVGEDDLGDEAALCGADVDGGLEFGPGEPLGDGNVGATAETCHGLEVAAEFFPIRADELKEALYPRQDFALRLAGAQGCCEPAPELVETVVGHLEYAADVRGLAFVEVEVS